MKPCKSRISANAGRCCRRGWEPRTWQISFGRTRRMSVFFGLKGCSGVGGSGVCGSRSLFSFIGVMGSEASGRIEARIVGCNILTATPSAFWGSQHKEGYNPSKVSTTAYTSFFVASESQLLLYFNSCGCCCCCCCSSACYGYCSICNFKYCYCCCRCRRCSCYCDCYYYHQYYYCYYITTATAAAAAVTATASTTTTTHDRPVATPQLFIC